MVFRLLHGLWAGAVLLAMAVVDAALGAWDWGWQAVRAARVRRVRGVFMVVVGGWFQAAFGEDGGSLKWVIKLNLLDKQ